MHWYLDITMHLNQLTITQASAGLSKKEFSTTELIKDCLLAIKEGDGNIHAYLSVFEDALEEAKKADEAIQQGHALPPLFGIPLAIKDNILIKGKICSAGSLMLKNYTAAYDATVIKKLKNQGAIFLGKTNMDEFAMGSSTENSAFGYTKNPHDTTRVPGGSSGGSAAAVAENLCVAGLGSDTGGSIRQPASLCGVVGLKPTYGNVSRHGLIAMASSLDQIGPISKSVEDAEILYGAIAGSDTFDSTTTQNTHQESIIKNKELKNIKIGVPKEYFMSGLDPEIEYIVKSILKKLENENASIREISLPHSQYALAAYYIIVPAEVSANLARFDGIRYGLSEATKKTSQDSSLYDIYTKTRAEGFGDEVKRRIMLGTYTLSAGYYDAYYIKAQRVRRLIQNDFIKAFKEIDIIIGPTTPTPAFKLGERKENPIEMYLADIYTVAVNLAGVPAISLPIGFVKRGESKLPVGLQIIGPHQGESKLFEFGKQIDKLIKI